MSEPKTIDLGPSEYRRLGERLRVIWRMPWWRRILCGALGLSLGGTGAWVLYVQARDGWFYGAAIMAACLLLGVAAVLLGDLMTGDPNRSGL
jgi:hypothetical protein